MNNSFYDLAEYNHIFATPSTHDGENEYYDSFVVLDGCQAVVANFEHFDDACSWARTAARHAQTYHRIITLEVYGCDNGAYSTDEDDDNTLVYSTDWDD